VIEGEGRFGMSVVAVCRRLRMSRQNFYFRRKQRERRGVDEGLVVALVQRERQLQTRLGTRKLWGMLQKDLAEAGVTIGRDRLFEVLRQRDLLVPTRVAEFPRTTNSHHYLPVFTNRIKDLEVTKPNEVWVGDITYLRTEEGFLYLALLTDKASRKIVGYHCGDTLESEGCLLALEKALRDLPAGARPIHHSDRGSQYCCHRYVDRLQERGLGISMTELDHCAENALAERMNGILKSEYGLGRAFRTKADAHRAVNQAVHLYNTRRPHTALKFRVPAEVHSLAA
jgi:transposase InsO family protein